MNGKPSFRRAMRKAALSYWLKVEGGSDPFAYSRAMSHIKHGICAAGDYGATFRA